MKEIIRLFPDHFQTLLLKDVRWGEIQEIRLRVHKRIETLGADSHKVLNSPLLSPQDLSHILNQISQFSLYRFKDQLKDGFITIEGGHRVGLAGKANTVNDSVETLKYISFMNIRIARSKPGQVERLLPYLYHNHKWTSTLIIGPPHSGKTTILRDLARAISSENQFHTSSKVAIVDERSEIAASLRGIPQLDVGSRTDVMDACPKVQGMMMMIRSMSPDILIVDEIGSIDDAEAIKEATFTGVEVICSVHGKDFQSVLKRPSTKILMEEGIFQRYVILERLMPSRPHTLTILNERGKQLVHFKGEREYGVDRRCDDLVRNDMGRI
ncbi:stage III sporulation protein AA [Halobacillus yeomjeoni]|uniref:stage III sporulation protein AA n=1 Tax=Halobacillus yeomjeoni TaxID=311194 RepID=UPI001CD640D4|nr:stage III sporulation protein AA [Halobacillus yeomjeoni]MCA0982784.1 stage III sporulation protein AA [Halobacillus yeomjeoni]